MGGTQGATTLFISVVLYLTTVGMRRGDFAFELS